MIAVDESADAPDMAVIKTVRSDRFQYRSATNPNPDGEPYIIEV